MHLTLRHIGN